MAAIPSAGPQQWARWHGGQGTDVATLHSRARCGRAETPPMEWKVQAETFPSSNCPVLSQGGQPLHEVPRLRVSPAAVPDPLQRLVGSLCGRKTPKAFLISDVLLRNCQAMLACHCHLCPGAQAERAAGPVWGYCLNQLL